MSEPIPYWPTTLPQAPTPDFSGGPVDYRHAFQPDQGAPITRPKGTGAIARFRVPFVLSVADFATFEEFHEETLNQGSARFIMRTQPQGTVRWWKFAASNGLAYDAQYYGPTLCRVAMELVRLPQTPWFADYVMVDSSRSPAWVADYDGEVYGIGADKVAASQLETIEGTYWVVRTLDNGTVLSAEETLTAGDITATAPMDETQPLTWTSGGEVFTWESGGTAFTWTYEATTVKIVGYDPL